MATAVGRPQLKSSVRRPIAPMTASGCRPLENDTAQDLKSVWDDFLAPAVRGCIAGEADSIVDRFIFSVVFVDGVNHNSQEHNHKWLAIAELLNQGCHRPSERAKAHIERAIYEESRPDEISAWPDRKARKAALKRLLVQIEGRALKKSEIAKSETIAEELHDLRGFREYLDVFCGVRSAKEVSSVAFDPAPTEGSVIAKSQVAMQFYLSRA